MAKEKKQNKTQPKKRSAEQKQKDQLVVVLEDMRNQLNLSFELQQATNKKLDGFMDETRENFKAVFVYLSRVEDDLAEIKQLKKEVAQIKKEQKADKEWIRRVERRLEKLEKGFHKIQSVCNCG